jgi:hypothetical protein
MDVFNLFDYQFAKKVCKDIPQILGIIGKFEKELAKYREYRDVANIQIAINDGKTMLDLHLKAYQPVLENKGKKI